MTSRAQIQRVRTPTGVLALVRQTAEKLLREGVLSGTLDGDLHAADAATVKAAIMASAVCDFCSAPGASHYHDVPDFGITTDPRGGTNFSQMVGTSTGGWMACDECDALIVAGKRRQLTDRAVSSHAFPKFSRRAVEELQEKFWQGMEDRRTATGIARAVSDFVEDRLPNYVAVPALSERGRRVEAMVRVTGLTVAQAEAAVRGELDRDAVAKLVAWRKGFGGPVDPRALADLLGGGGPQKPLADVKPHWQRALDARFAALSSVLAVLNAGQTAVQFKEAVDLNDAATLMRMVHAARQKSEFEELGFREDVRYLRAADAYSFNAETVAAIREAAAGIPRGTPLSSIETPNTGAGWFWFAEPLPVTASPIVSDEVHALLWGWSSRKTKSYELELTDEMVARLGPGQAERLSELAAQAKATGNLPREYTSEVSRMLSSIGITQDTLDRHVAVKVDDEPSIMFSAYVVDRRGKVAKPGGVAPSTRWYWPLSMTLDEMLAYNGRLWDDEYGPGKPHSTMPHLVGRAETLDCVEQLSVFFVMACLWFKQTVPVLTREPGHVERHERKRYAREHKLSEPPSVQVVALRKSLRVPAEKAEGAQAEGARQYHCRWIVKGHPRLQACGPGRKDKKLIWIEAHPAGPADKPLRTREKVYAVIR